MRLAEHACLGRDSYSEEYANVRERSRTGYNPLVTKQTLVDVYAYLDYRAFLRDFYAAKKAKSAGFSYRSFSKRAGVSSPNYLKLVVDGQRSLSAKMAEKFAQACGLDADASRYFVHLVAFNQAKTSTERSLHYGKLTSFQHYRQAHKLEIAHAAYYSDWFMPAIRELAASREFRADPEWIADQLIPNITPLQAARALETLCDLGLLVEDETGRLVQADALLSTGPETRGLHIAAFHRVMTQRAIESIDLVPPQERDISSLTLCLSRGGLKAFKERIQRVRRELLELSALETEPEQVVQINFQLFPLSRAGKRGGSR
ncbi:MAG TPA: TIGR02147 family protein [Polyangiaceae bacterium]|nr:TIGR02147 family protein [Polyangiaceae bacterium]